MNRSHAFTCAHFFVSKHMSIVFTAVCIEQVHQLRTCGKHTRMKAVVECEDGKQPAEKVVAAVKSSAILNTEKQVNIFRKKITK